MPGMPTVDVALLVDAQQLDLVITSRLLTATRFTRRLATSTSLDEARSMVERSLGTEEQPSLIFIDARLLGPTAPDFFDYLHTLLLTHDNAPYVVLMGGTVNHPSIQKVLHHPAVIGFVPKPLTPVALREFLLTRVKTRLAPRTATMKIAS